MELRFPASSSTITVSDIVKAAAALEVEVLDIHARPVETPVYSGTVLLEEVQPGLLATANDVEFLLDEEFTIDRGSSLVCSILLAGDADRVEVGNFGSVTKVLERPVLIGSNKTTRCRGWCIAGHKSRGAGFVIKPSFFDRFGQHVVDDELTALRDFLGSEFRAEILSRSSRLIEIANRSLNHTYNGTLGRLFLESNTLSFVVEVAELLRDETRKVALLGRRHYDRTMEARDIIDANLVKPPRTLELAQRVGLNVTTLQECFKTVFGTTIFGYVRNQRLLMARILMTEHGLAVAEAGYRVGFANAAAFSAAYRKHFGYPPRQETSPPRD